MANKFGREFTVCNVDDLQDDQMKEFDVGNDKKILIVKQNGTFSALGAACTHYGAPLVKGVLCNGRIRCPWHGACFNATSGDIEDYPGLDSLAKFEVFVKDGKVKVKVTEEGLQTGRRSKPLSRKQAGNEETILIIGGGAAAQTCAETLRQEGFTGNIIMATKEKNLPYDRPKLSKMMDVDVKTILLRPKEFYDNGDIQVLTNKEASEIDILQRKVSFKDGQNLKYDKLLLATGAIPNYLTVKGYTLNNIFLLRTPEDALAIARVSQGKDVAVVGSSFIGMEVASYLSEKAKSVTVISLTPVPFERVLANAVGARLRKLFEENGVKFLSGVTVAEYRGKSGVLSEIVLNNKEVLKVDICVVGVGVRPSTDFVSGSGIPINKNGFIKVDKRMRTEVETVYAAGDIAEFPLFLRENQGVCISHWQMAHAHGRIAALNMLNKATDIQSVPYFWTVLFKKSVRYAGFGEGFDDVIIDGDLEALQFVAYYTKGNDVVAAASMNSDPVVSKFAEVLASKKTLTKDQIRNDPKGWLNSC